VTKPPSVGLSGSILRQLSSRLPVQFRRLGAFAYVHRRSEIPKYGTFALRKAALQQIFVTRKQPRTLSSEDHSSQKALTAIRVSPSLGAPDERLRCASVPCRPEAGLRGNEARLGRFWRTASASAFRTRMR
jgi:hypothetical protein